ncbi:hypothetical protein [Ottowia testudinis]|uniref:Uncharacterized protein n=1 Tax=Ottowia testudinis TaxID=2816950 RepID=A0A975H4E8_9BURK|nr:hypothetical protein [Ottowia testudinis]QTD46246.1 hypothetical protein J1M35_04920 [Ottowia testudinis]
MKSVRERIWPHGLSAPRSAKASAPSFDVVWHKASSSLQKADAAAYADMTPGQRDIAVPQKIIQGTGKSDPTFDALVRGADDAGRGLTALKYGGRAMVAVGAVVDGVSVTQEVQKSLQTGD